MSIYQGELGRNQDKTMKVPAGCLLIPSSEPVVPSESAWDYVQRMLKHDTAKVFDCDRKQMQKVQSAMIEAMTPPGCLFVLDEEPDSREDFRAAGV